MNNLVKRVYPDAACLYIPYSLLYPMVYMQEKLFSWMGRKPFLTRYRLTSSQKSILYDSAKLQAELRWKPPVSVKEGIKVVLEHEANRNMTPAF
jgi:nucleoside-diphosphate-sugar epimerase